MKNKARKTMPRPKSGGVVRARKPDSILEKYTIRILCQVCGCESPVIARIPIDTPNRQPICASALCFHCESDITTQWVSFAGFKRDARVKLGIDPRTHRAVPRKAKKGRK